MADQPLQGSKSVIVWLHADTAEEYVPRSVADALADALSRFVGDGRGHQPWCKRDAETCRWCAASKALVAYRAGRQETR